MSSPVYPTIEKTAKSNFSRTSPQNVHTEKSLASSYSLTSSPNKLVIQWKSGNSIGGLQVNKKTKNIRW